MNTYDTSYVINLLLYKYVQVRFYTSFYFSCFTVAYMCYKLFVIVLIKYLIFLNVK